MGVFRLHSLRVFPSVGGVEAKSDCVRYRSAATASASVLKADTRGKGRPMLRKGITLGDRPNTERSGLAAVEIKILSGFLLAMSLLLFGGSYTYRTSAKFANSVQWVAHTQDVR